MLKFSPKQNEYIREANKRWNLKVGAVRSGKSYVDVNYIIPQRLRAVSGKSGLNLILGVSRETIERDVLSPMREMYSKRLVGTINGRNIAMVCGEEVYCLGAEKVSQVAKIQGMSVKYCYGDEIAKWKPEIFAMLQSRLDKPYSRFDGACNPESPNHWLKEFIDKEDLDIYCQHYTIFDNPFLPREFVENLCKEYEGTVYYGRYINGEWTLAEGLIYPLYEKALEAAPDGDAADYCLSIDYGTMNAFAALLWELHGGVWYATRGYYYSGRETGVQKTDEEYGYALDDLISDIMENRDSRRSVLSSSRIIEKMKTIVDPSAASFITLLRKKKWYTVLPADNAVLDGIRDTASAMYRGLIKIDPSLTFVRKELAGYIWDDTAGEDRPVKVNDHACDAIRYFVRTKRLAVHKTQYRSIMG